MFKVRFCVYNGDMARPKTGVTPIRTIRIPDGIWNAAQQKAAERGETMTQVILRALHRYIRSK